jgi:hypothetical protein
MQIRKPCKKESVRLFLYLGASTVPTFSVLAVVRQGRVRAFVLYQLPGGERYNMYPILDNTATGPSLFESELLLNFFRVSERRSYLGFFPAMYHYQVSIVFV